MQNLKEVIENLKAEQKKQGIAPAGFSIRERVEGRLEELENEVEQLRYESACFTIRILMTFWLQSSGWYISMRR